MEGLDAVESLSAKAGRSKVANFTYSELPNKQLCIPYFLIECPRKLFFLNLEIRRS